MAVYQLLFESRVDEVRRRYPNLTDEQVSALVQMDPTDTKKYLLWLAREAHNIFSVQQKTTDFVKQILIDWESNINRLTFDMFPDFVIHHGFTSHANPTPTNFKDIQTYSIGEVKDLTTYLKSIPTNKEINDLAKRETEKIYEGPLDGYNVLIVRPLSYRSSCHYGATTKWCTAAKTTDYNYDSITRSGELYYMIFKDEAALTDTTKKPIFKYAILFKASNDPQVYDEADKQVEPERFFAQFPGIRKIFKDKLPITFYEGLLLINKAQNVDDIDFKSIIKNMDDYSRNDKITFEDRNLETILEKKIKIYIDEPQLITMFSDEESRDYVSTALATGYKQENYSRDEYQDKEDFNEGYVFDHFTTDHWKGLLRYFRLCDTSGSLLIRDLMSIRKSMAKGKTVGTDYRVIYTKLAKILNKAKHVDITKEIVERYGIAMESAINTAGDEEIESELKRNIEGFFKSVCKDEVKIEGKGSITVTIADVLRWYQDGDLELPDNDELRQVGLDTIIAKISEDNQFQITLAYEIYYGGDMDQDEFKSEFDKSLADEINNMAENLEYDPEIVENMEIVDAEIAKLEHAGIYLGETYQDPSKDFVLKIYEADLETTKFIVTIRNKKSGNTKRTKLTADRIINILRISPMVDIIDEVYALFSKIIS
jgi:hypothetical protein